MNPFIPDRFFLTSGVGCHAEKIVSYDFALTDAGIPLFNHVTVSSILPPHCKEVEFEEGIQILSKNVGSIVFSVQAKITSKDVGHLESAIGVGFPKNENGCGYIAEYYQFFKDGRALYETKTEVEKLVCIMTEAKDIKIKDAQRTIIGSSFSDGKQWTTLITAAVFIQPCFVA